MILHFLVPMQVLLSCDNNSIDIMNINICVDIAADSMNGCKYLSDTNHHTTLVYTKKIAHTPKGMDVTFTHAGMILADDRSFIDRIFVSSNIKVKHHVVLTEKPNGIFVSDHNVEVADILHNKYVCGINNLC